MNEHIVICQSIVKSDGEWNTVYYFDGRRFSTRREAIDHGFTIGRSDDFNTGVVRAGEIVWFGYMDKELPDYDLNEITRHFHGGWPRPIGEVTKGVRHDARTMRRMRG